MKKFKSYSINPARGQALLNFQGRRMPEKMEVYEADTIEEVCPASTPSLFPEEHTDSSINPDFRNLLMQGDCLSACAYLKDNNIQADLVYIDPPFASGANYAKKIHLRNGGKTAISDDSSIIGEEIMYGDIWQKEDYLNWLYERLLAIREIMSESASIYVHLDWHIGHYVKVLMDEVFGEENFVNEIVWCYSSMQTTKNKFSNKHDILFLYKKNEEMIYNIIYEDYPVEYKKRFKYEDGHGKFMIRSKTGQGDLTLEDEKNFPDQTYRQYIKEGSLPKDWWIIDMINSNSDERINYTTQKPEALLERIIKASSDEGMIVADFFCGSGTTAKVAANLNRRFIACDIGINALQTTRDRLVKAGAGFDVLRIRDGLRLFRNPAQTSARIFNLIDGFRPRSELDLHEFWDGGIARADGNFAPVKFSGINEKLTRELLDHYLEEIYALGETSSNVSGVVIIYAFRDGEVDQSYLNRTLHDMAKTDLNVQLMSLDALLGEKKDALFTPDNADIAVTPLPKGCRVEIKKYYSPYLKRKLDEYNALKTRKGQIDQDLCKSVGLSDNGLELVESVQFDTTLEPVWKSNPELEDKAGIKERIKGMYVLDCRDFKMKIRNIAGDEIVIGSRGNWQISQT